MTAAERLSAVWELTREVWLFTGEDPDRPMLRSFVVLLRGTRGDR